MRVCRVSKIKILVIMPKYQLHIVLFTNLFFIEIGAHFKIGKIYTQAPHAALSVRRVRARPMPPARSSWLPSPHPLPTLSTHQPHNIHRVLSRAPGSAAPAQRVRRRRGAGISRLRRESGRRPLTPTAGEAGLRLLGATALGRSKWVRLN